MTTSPSGSLRIWLAPSAFFPSRGGVEELTLQLARQYQRQGHDVRVIVHRHPEDLASQDEVEGVPVNRLQLDLPGANPRRLLGYPLTVRRQFAALDSVGPAPDVVHIQCAANQVLPISLWASRRKVPLVLTTQGEVAMDAGRIYQHSLQMRTSLRFGSYAAAALTACSRRAGDDAASVAGRFKDCQVVPNGVDPEQWEVTPLPQSPSYGAWGRHVPQKGLDLLIRAFEQVREKLPGAVLRLGGDGPEHENLRALAGEGVEFLGPLDRSGVQALLQQSRVAVVPSRLEPFGIVGVEAMASGRTVVWSTNGGLADATGGLGYGVDPNDITRLAEAMVQAHERPLPPATARSHAESLSWTMIADQYLHRYESVLRSRVGHSEPSP